jgi:collagenase-like PrtC family protease
MKYYSVPADFKKETIDEYSRLNDTYRDSRVIETYGNITVGSPLESGRSVDVLPQVDIGRLRRYVEYSRQKNIDFSYTINSPHMNSREFTRKGILEICSFLGELHGAGVTSLTISLPSIVEIIKSTGYDFKLKASVICEITNANKAEFYKKMGFERIVADESINRDFQTLKRIRETFGDRLEIIVNTICHKECPYRMFHYNQVAFDSISVSSKASSNYYSHRCLLRRYERPGTFLKLSWVRPEDIRYYTDIGVHYFKLQGRQSALKGNPVQAVECYFKESYNGNLLDLLEVFSPHSKFRIHIDNRALDGFLEPYYRRDQFCKHDCRHCNHCDSYAKKAIVPGEVEKVYENIKQFLDQYDQFKIELNSITDSNATKMQSSNLEIDFVLD